MLPPFMAGARSPGALAALRSALAAAPAGCGRRCRRWLCLALFVCTGMIYACLRFLQEWHTPLTVINYILLGGASGFTLAAALAALAAPELVRPSRRLALLITLLAWSAAPPRCCAMRASSRVDAADGHRHQASADRAEGAGLHGRLVQHARILPRHAARPCCARSNGSSCCWLSCCRLLLLLAGWRGLERRCWRWPLWCSTSGLLAERWFFFAQANHPQNLYYQAIS